MTRLIALGEADVPGFGRFVIRDRGGDRQIPSFAPDPALRAALEGADHGLSAPWSDVVEALRRGEPCEVVGLGTFAVRERKGYRARDPRTGEQVEFPPKRSTTMAISDAWRAGSRRRIPPCELWLDFPVPAPAPPSASSYERTPGDLVAEMCATLSYLVPEGSRRASVVAELEALEPDLDVAAFAARLERVLARGGADSRSRPIVPDVIEARPDELAELRAQLDRLKRAAARCYASEPREHHRVVAATLEPHREATTVQAVDDPLAYTHVALQDTLEASPEVADALPQIAAFRNVRILTLFGNGLVGLPIPTAGLGELRAVHLAQNELVAFPEALYRCEALEWIELSDNPLRSVPEGIERLEALRYLGLRGTELRSAVLDGLRARLPRCAVVAD